MSGKHYEHSFTITVEQENTFSGVTVNEGLHLLIVAFMYCTVTVHITDLGS